MELFVIFVCAHVLGDFLLQPSWMARKKNRFFSVCLHAGIHAALMSAIVVNPALWTVPVIVFLSHLLIDWLKSKCPDTGLAFVLDQFFHISVLGGLAYGISSIETWAVSGRSYDLLVLISGFVAVVLGSGHLVSRVTARLTEKNELIVDGLEQGGKLIGQLERSLIYLLMIIGQPAGIGFLVAAKSILRFKESEDQKLAEYVLIGTLLSFSLAIALSALTLKSLAL